MSNRSWPNYQLIRVPLWPLPFGGHHFLWGGVTFCNRLSFSPINSLVNSFHMFQETLIIRDWHPLHEVFWNIYSETHLPQRESQNCSMKGSCRGTINSQWQSEVSEIPVTSTATMKIGCAVQPSPDNIATIEQNN